MMRTAALLLAGAAMTAAPVAAQTVTLQNSRAEMSRASGKPLAKSLKEWWEQLRGLPTAKPVEVLKIADWIAQGYGPVKTNAPDVVGAFRVICPPTGLNYDDAVLYPGVKNGSPHGHIYYCTKGVDANSTPDTLRNDWKGGYNPLLGSGYWSAWPQRAKDGKVIQIDYASIYYKRRPITDPMCFKQAPKGCIPLVRDIRMVSGYDMRRMGQAQPENATFTHRCISEGKPSIERPLVADAVADCGGAGQIMTAIGFPECSDGRADSPDHRSHVAQIKYRGQSYAECDADHPYLMTHVTEQIAFTVEADDEPIVFSSDAMPGMPQMPGGSTFHADYLYGLHDYLAQRIEACINALLSCSDGETGEGMMLKRDALTYKASPRLVDAPVR